MHECRLLWLVQPVQDLFNEEHAPASIRLDDVEMSLRGMDVTASPAEVA